MAQIDENAVIYDSLTEKIPAIRQLLSRGGRGLKTLKVDEKGTFTRDCICLEDGGHLVSEAEEAIAEFEKSHGHTPTQLYIKGIGLASVVESASEGRMAGRTAIVTGAAQGFGEGIARALYAEGANIVVADLNEATGRQTAASLGERALFVKVDVSSLESVKELVRSTVAAFGAVDLFISNAGVLRAGGLEAMTPETLEFVTRINYFGYFNCAKVASHVMKIQTAVDPEYFADIIQINSKSGLRGSKANFAYAGGKFGGIGLTQSFALELAPFRVKVNSVCPGNFYDGPLWSDPERGLFVQYLAAGKVPGAQTVEDVKAYYLSQVPMRKGCTPADVAKAIMYAVEQTGETGQAIPVTGGQVMLA